MKLLADTMDQDERMRTQVFLDDVNIGSTCVEADDEEGYAILIDYDEDGIPRLNEAKDALLFKRVEGVVRFEVSEGCGCGTCQCGREDT